MVAFTLRRIGSGLVLIILIPSIAFLLMSLASGNVARNVLGRNASAEQVAAFSSLYGLDRPIWEQYLAYVRDVFQGDFGTSYFTSEDVVDAMLSRVPVTISLVLGATIVAAIVSIGFGVAAALYRGWVDRVLQVVAILGFALPGFWLAMMLVLVFALELGWFPATGYVPFLRSPSGWAYSLVLPITALAIGAIASAAQQFRGEMIDTLRQDWVRTLRSRGLPERRVLFRHVLRNASVSGLTVLALQFVGLLGGAVFIEQIFSLPGIGLVLATSTDQGDIPLVMGVVIVTTIIVVVVNLVIDLFVAFLNPKARTA